MDDDIVVSPDDLNFAFRAWSEESSRLGSPFVRSHVIDRQTGQYSYLMSQMGSHTFHDVRARKYSIALTKVGGVSGCGARLVPCTTPGHQRCNTLDPCCPS